MKKPTVILIILALLIPILALADSYTTNYRMTKPSRGSANWDTKINTNFDTIDGLLLQALSGERYTTVLRPETYGTPGDGASDDTTIVQAAIDACDALYGCKISLSCRNWRFNVEVDVPNVWIDSECGAQHNSWWTENYIGPYDHTKPVIAVKPIRISGHYRPNTGFLATNIHLRGNNTTSKQGIHIEACEYCSMDHFDIMYFTEFGLKIGDTDNNCTSWSMANHYSNFNITASTIATGETDAVVFERGSAVDNATLCSQGAWITSQNFTNGHINGPTGASNTGHTVKNGTDALYTNVYFQVADGKGLYKTIQSTNGIYYLVNSTVEGDSANAVILSQTYSDSLYHMLRASNTSFTGYFQGKNGLQLELTDRETIQYQPRFYGQRHGGTMNFYVGIDANETAQSRSDNSTTLRRTPITDGAYGSLLELYGAHGIEAESPVAYNASAAALFARNTNATGGYALAGYSANVPFLSHVHQGAATYNDISWAAARLYRSSGDTVLDGFGTGIDVQLQAADADAYSAGSVYWSWESASLKSSVAKFYNRETDKAVTHLRLGTKGMNNVRFPNPDLSHHAGVATTGSIAYHVNKISTANQTIELMGDQTYSLLDNLAIPANVKVVFQNGAMLSPASGKTITFDNPGQIVANRTQIFTGDGSIAFTNSGEIHHEWFGSTGAALVKAYTASADGSLITTKLKSFSMSNGVDVTTKTVSFQGLPNYGTTITSTGDYAFRYSKKTSGNHESFYIRDFLIDGNDAGTDGIIIQEAANGLVERVTATQFTNAAFSVDGIGYGVGVGGYMVGTTFRNCMGKDSNYGYLISKKENNVAFQVVTLDSSWAYGNVYGVYATGAHKTDGFIIRLANAEVESNTTRGITLLNGARMEADTTYVEQTGPGPNYDHINYYCDNGTVAKFTNSRCPVMPGDANSTTTYSEFINSHLNTWSLYDPGPHRLGGWSKSSDCLGSPYWHHVHNSHESCDRGPTSGSRVAKGQRWIDDPGNVWIAVEDGTSSVPRWKNEGNQVVIPIPYSVVNGHSSYQHAAWCTEVPALVSEVELVVTDDFDSNGTNVGFGVGNHATTQEVWMSKTDTKGKLTTGAVFRGTQNTSATAWLTDDNGTTPKSKYLAGHSLEDIYGFMQLEDGWNLNVNSCFVVYPVQDEEGWPVFTAGQAYLVIRMTPLGF